MSGLQHKGGGSLGDGIPGGVGRGLLSQPEPQHAGGFTPEATGAGDTGTGGSGAPASLSQGSYGSEQT